MTEREKFDVFFYGLVEHAMIGDKERELMFIAWQAATKSAAPQWIQVSERLPEFKHGCYEYLVVTDGNVQHDYFNCPVSGGDYFEPFWNHYGDHVTHWMPLPAAPEVK